MDMKLFMYVLNKSKYQNDALLINITCNILLSSKSFGIYSITNININPAISFKVIPNLW